MSKKEKQELEEEVEKTEATNQEASEQEVGEKEEEKKDPLEELQEQYNTLNDKYLRLYSEFENFRRRTAKERLDLMKNAGEDIFVTLLPVLDDFKRGLANMETATDVKSVKEGVDLIYGKLTKELNAKGLKPMESKGKEFDPEFHEAITQVPVESKKEKGKVFDVVEDGYFLNDKVIRFAKVVVGS